MGFYKEDNKMRFFFHFFFFIFFCNFFFEGKEIFVWFFKSFF